MTILAFKSSQAGVEQFPLRNDHHVEATHDLVSTKNLSYQSFSAISLDRPTQLSRCRNAQPADTARGGEDEERAIPAGAAQASLIHLLELGASADPFVGPERMVRSGLFVPPGHSS